MTSFELQVHTHALSAVNSVEVALSEDGSRPTIAVSVSHTSSIPLVQTYILDANLLSNELGEVVIWIRYHRGFKFVLENE